MTTGINWAEDADDIDFSGFIHELQDRKKKPAAEETKVTIGQLVSCELIIQAVGTNQEPSHETESPQVGEEKKQHPTGQLVQTSPPEKKAIVTPPQAPQPEKKAIINPEQVRPGF